MREYPEAQDIVNQFAMMKGMGGGLIGTPIPEMSNIDYECMIVCENAWNIAKEIGMFNNKNKVVNKDAVMNRTLGTEG